MHTWIKGTTKGTHELSTRNPAVTDSNKIRVTIVSNDAVDFELVTRFSILSIVVAVAVASL